jgi:hypothetical protein
MALIIRKSKSMARFVRRHWVPKGTTGNTHGYAAEVSLGSMPLTAKSWPQGFEQNFPEGALPLSEDERALVQREVFEAAVARAAALAREEAERAADPGWRIAEAVRLLRHAVPLGAHRPVERPAYEELVELVATLRNTAPTLRPLADPIQLVIEATKTATDMVEGGYYGTRTSDAVMKETIAASLWKRLREAVSEDEVGSLRAALQKTGWVARR